MSDYLDTTKQFLEARHRARADRESGSLVPYSGPLRPVSMRLLDKLDQERILRKRINRNSPTTAKPQQSTGEITAQQVAQSLQWTAGRVAEELEKLDDRIERQQALILKLTSVNKAILDEMASLTELLRKEPNRDASILSEVRSGLQLQQKYSAYFEPELVREFLQRDLDPTQDHPPGQES